MIGTFIQQLRKKHNFTQEYLASQLKISRPTYAQIEQNERDITISEAKKLSDIFGISFSGLLNERKETVNVEIVQDKKVDKAESKEDEMRVSVPQNKIPKFKEVLLYILNKIGAKPNVGETVLYKLLYFIDFDYYEKFETQLMGATYIKNHHGPTPVMFTKVVEDMKEKGEIVEVKSKYFQYPQKKYLPIRQAKLDNLTAQELEVMNAVIRRLGDKCAKELSDYSHNDVPWMTAEEGKPIDYEAVFYRTEPYSVRKYDDTL